MKKTVLNLVFVLAGALSARAQLYIHDVSPDTTLTAGPMLQYFSVIPPSMAEFDIYQDPANEVSITVHGFFGYGQVLFDGAYPAKVDKGYLVNSSGLWVEAGGQSLNKKGTDGNWCSFAADNYMGIRFKTSTGSSDWNYGWIRLGVATDGSSFTIRSWGYNVLAGMPIVADDGSASTNIPELIQTAVVNLVYDGQQIRFSGLPDKQLYPVQISDINGRIVLQQQIQYTEGISISQFAHGVYIVQVPVNGTLYHFKTAW